MSTLRFIKKSKAILYILSFVFLFSLIATLYLNSFVLLEKAILLYLFIYLFLPAFFILLFIEIIFLKLSTYIFKNYENRITILFLAIFIQLIFYIIISYINSISNINYMYIITISIMLSIIPFSFLLSLVIMKKTNRISKIINNSIEKYQREVLNITIGIIIMVILFLFIFRNTKNNTKIKSNYLQHKNIILITIDSLRFDYQGYHNPNIITPNIDRLFKEGILFNNFFVHAPYTWSSLSSIMTSLESPFHLVRKNGQVLNNEFLTIAEILNAKDYICYTPGDLNFNIMGIDQGFRGDLSWFSKEFIRFLKKLGSFIEVIDHIGKYGFARNSSLDSTLRALKFLKENRNKRFFLWIHYYNEPHAPYYAPVYYTKIYNNEKKSWITGGLEILYGLNDVPEFKRFLEGNKLNEDDLIFLKNLYKAEITNTDFQIGMILKSLKNHNLLNNTMIIVTSDHGEDFNDRNHFLHSNNLYNTLIHVPLIIKIPNFNKHKVVDSMARGIDIAPTILQYLKIKIPDHFHGNSLLGYINNSENRIDNWCYSETLKYGDKYPYNKFGFSYTSSKYKYINLPLEDREELYFLDADAYETSNLAKGHEHIISKIKNEIESYFNIESIIDLVPDKDMKILKEQQEMLRSLGYVNID